MRLALPQGTVAPERRGGWACFAQVKGGGPAGAGGHGAKQARRPGAIALTSGNKVRFEPEAEAQISTFAPSSTMRLLGRRRKSAAAAALWCMPAKSFSRHIAMPSPKVGITMSRLRK